MPVCKNSNFKLGINHNGIGWIYNCRFNCTYMLGMHISAPARVNTLLVIKPGDCEDYGDENYRLRRMVRKGTNKGEESDYFDSFITSSINGGSPLGLMLSLFQKLITQLTKFCLAGAATKYIVKVLPPLMPTNNDFTPLKS